MNSSTFADIELGKRGILAHQRAFATVGHNLANLETEGYSRQRVRMQTTDPLYAADLTRVGSKGQIGTGVDVAIVERIRDSLLDDQLIATNDDLSFWQTRNDYLVQLNQILQEVDGSSTRQVMDAFWQGWQDLAADPASGAAREQLLERGLSLVDQIRSRYHRLDQLQLNIDQSLVGQVNEVNHILANIAQLNVDIRRSLAIGDQPNDLLDRRDLLVDRLSGFLSIRVERSRDPDEFLIHFQGRHLLQGDVVSGFTLRQLQRQQSEVLWQRSEDEEVNLVGGSLTALVRLRDRDVAGAIADLDRLALHYGDMVNTIHRQATGLDGETGRDFFLFYPEGDPVSGDYDVSGDGIADQTRIFRISGSKVLDEKRPLGMEGQLTLAGIEGQEVTIDYQASDTVEQLFERVNQSSAQVFIRLDHLGRVEIRPAMDSPELHLVRLADTGAFLSSYSGLLAEGAVFDAAEAGAAASLAEGANWRGAVQAHAAEWLSVNQDLQRDTSRIAAAYTTAGKPGLGNNQAASDIAALAHLPVMSGAQQTLADFYAHRIAGYGAQQQRSEVFQQTFNTDIRQLQQLRQSLSGVSLDEEFASMIRFQRGYEAAARFLSASNELLDIIVNRMGVVS